MVRVHALLKVGVPSRRPLPDGKPPGQLKDRRVALANTRSLRKPGETPTIGNFSKLGGAVSCERAGTNLLLLFHR